MIDAKMTFRGKYQDKGGFFRVWEVATDMNPEEVAKWCIEHLVSHEIPPYKEWRKNTLHSGEKHGDKEYYNSGYYSLREIGGGYEFRTCTFNL